MIVTMTGKTTYKVGLLNTVRQTAEIHCYFDTCTAKPENVFLTYFTDFYFFPLYITLYNIPRIYTYKEGSPMSWRGHRVANFRICYLTNGHLKMSSGLLDTAVGLPNICNSCSLVDSNCDPSLF